MAAVIYIIVIVFIVVRVLKKAKQVTDEGAGARNKIANTIRSTAQNQQSATVQRPLSVSQSVAGTGQRAENRQVAYSNSKRTVANNGVSKHMAKESRDMSLRDDRHHDWLARQLAEERRAKAMVSEMFKLKMEHRSSCEVEMIKQFHADHCDAGAVDTARVEG